LPFRLKLDRIQLVLFGVLSMFLNSLAAQTTAASTGSTLQMLLPLVLVFGVMYFLIIRPQNKRMKDQQNMQNAIKVGDTVATTGGLIGRVVKLEEKEVHVDFNRSGAAVRVLRSAIVGVLDPTNKAKEMTQQHQEGAKSATKQSASTGSKASAALNNEAAPHKSRIRSPMNRGRAGGNRRPTPKKQEDQN
jgi:preprotein translocase subunit YajC